MLPRWVIPPLKVLLALFFVGLVVLQAMSLPGSLAHMVEEDPSTAPIRWPLFAVLLTGLVCVQVVVVCTWRLLDLVRDDRIFDDRAFPWVDGIIAAVCLAWLLLVGLLVWAGATADDPGVPVVLTGMVLASGVLGLLMVVMRALLRQATALRTEMAQVI